MYNFSLQHFTYSCHNTFTIRVRSVIAVQLLLFFQSQFKTNAPNVLRFNKCTPVHI